MEKRNKIIDTYRQLKMAQILLGCGSIATTIATILSGCAGHDMVTDARKKVQDATDNLMSSAENIPAYVIYLDNREREFRRDMESGKLSESLGNEWIDNLHGVEGVLDYYYYWSPAKEHSPLDDEIAEFKTANVELNKAEVDKTLRVTGGIVASGLMCAGAAGCGQKRRELLDEDGYNKIG